MGYVRYSKRPSFPESAAACWRLSRWSASAWLPVAGGLLFVLELPQPAATTATARMTVTLPRTRMRYPRRTKKPDQVRLRCGSGAASSAASVTVTPRGQYGTRDAGRARGSPPADRSVGQAGD